jgi:hypothetical protein
VLDQGGGRARQFNRWEWSWRSRSRKARPTIAERWLGWRGTWQRIDCFPNRTSQAPLRSYRRTTSTFAHAGSPPLQKQQIAQALPSSSSPDAYMSFPVASRFKLSMSTCSSKATASRKTALFAPPSCRQPSRTNPCNIGQCSRARLVAPWIASRSGGIRCAPKRREDRQLFDKIAAGV